MNILGAEPSCISTSARLHTRARTLQASFKRRQPGLVTVPAVRFEGSEMLEGLARTTAHHVSDLNHHLLAVRSANAELRDRIDSLRSQLAEAESVRQRRMEQQSALGGRVLAAEEEIERARAMAVEKVSSIQAAADHEARSILGAARLESAQLLWILDAAVGTAEPATVVRLTPRTEAVNDAVPQGPEHPSQRIAAM